MRYKKERYRSGEKALTPREYEKLISVVDRQEDEVCFKLAVSIGARREDLASIKVHDIDLDELKLSFYEQKKRRIHTVPLSPEMARLIKQLLNSRGKNQTVDLFPFTGRTMYDRLQRYCDKAEIPRRPFHALRATCIKRCQSAGWSIEQVSRLTGDTIAVIQEHYSYPSSSEMQEVAELKPVI
jgi:integrase